MSSSGRDSGSPSSLITISQNIVTAINGLSQSLLAVAPSGIGVSVSSTIGSGSAIALTTATPANLTSIPLTAGDWDVWADFVFNGGATTTVNNLQGSISLTSGTFDANPGNFAFLPTFGQTAVNGQTPTVTAGPRRISIAGPTTVYAVALANFGVSTLNVYGIIQARRVR